jgi:hypothetical protein
MPAIGFLGFPNTFLAAMLDELPPIPAHLVCTLKPVPEMPNPPRDSICIYISMLLIIYLFYVSYVIYYLFTEKNWEGELV